MKYKKTPTINRLDNKYAKDTPMVLFNVGMMQYNIELTISKMKDIYIPSFCLCITTKILPKTPESIANGILQPAIKKIFLAYSGICPKILNWIGNVIIKTPKRTKPIKNIITLIFFR